MTATDRFVPGTKARLVTFMTNQPYEPCVIVRPRKINLPLPGPDWRIVRFDDGGQLCAHVSRLEIA